MCCCAASTPDRWECGIETLAGTLLTHCQFLDCAKDLYLLHKRVNLPLQLPFPSLVNLSTLCNLRPFHIVWFPTAPWPTQTHREFPPCYACWRGLFRLHKWHSDPPLDPHLTIFCLHSGFCCLTFWCS